MSRTFELKNSNASERSYYCSMKFKYLKIDLESRTTYTCHAAAPHSVDFNWLNQNTGQLFNHDTNIQEREMMLANQRNASCEQNCWQAEDQSAVSPRLVQQGAKRTHIDVHTQPEIIDLTINGDCNLTCSYCCKEYSSSWRRDVVNNGDYSVSSDRYSATDKDRVLLKISQPKLKQTDRYQSLLDEIVLAAPGLKRLVVTGGEPFLDNKLVNTLKKLQLQPDAAVEIYTGLGVNISRFAKIINELQSIRNVEIIVSAESVQKFLEFNRYGSNWSDFESKIKMLQTAGINMRFHSTLTNLTLFGFAEFYHYFQDHKIVINFAYQPDMMAPYVLDNTSKQMIIEQLQVLPESVRDPIIKSMAPQPTEANRIDIGKFLIEFVHRRPDLDLGIFPEHFLQWTEQHVV